MQRRIFGAEMFAEPMVNGRREVTRPCDKLPCRLGFHQITKFVQQPLVIGLVGRKVGISGFAHHHFLKRKMGRHLRQQFAHQDNYQRNPLRFGLDYGTVEVGAASAGAALKVGYEVLEGDGRIGFATPLATLHRFQGFADVFTTTPVNGVADLYLTGDYTFSSLPFVKSVRLAVWYHDFQPQRGVGHFGDEIDLVSTVTFNNNVVFELKYATYDADAFATDRSKFWVSLAFRL